jgi:hypothetical protein
MIMLLRHIRRYRRLVSIRVGHATEFTGLGTGLGLHVANFKSLETCLPICVKNVSCVETMGVWDPTIKRTGLELPELKSICTPIAAMKE